MNLVKSIAWSASIVSFGIILAASNCSAQIEPDANDNLEVFRKMNQERYERSLQLARLSQLLNNVELRKELEIVPDQVARLQELVREFQRVDIEFTKKNGDRQQEVNRLINEKKIQQAIEVAREMHAEHDEECEKLVRQVENHVLPHQFRRLQQIAKQKYLKHASPFKDQFGIPLALADELELTSKEREKLLATTKQARKKYYEELEKLQTTTMGSILNSLSKEKREKIEKIVGEHYDHEKYRRIASEKKQTDRK